MSQRSGNGRSVAGHRVVTLCMNPALDIATSTPQVRPTDKLRCAAARYDPGGGGVNVARVAEVLGAATTAVFPAGGAAGQAVEELLVAEGLAVQRVRIGGPTRESFTVNDLSADQQYRFVLPGPELTLAEQTECLLHLRRAAAHAAIVVASGSLPPGVPPPGGLDRRATEGQPERLAIDRGRGTRLPAWSSSLPRKLYAWRRSPFKSDFRRESRALGTAR